MKLGDRNFSLGGMRKNIIRHGLACSLLCSTTAWTLDNPDAANLMQEFESGSYPYLESIEKTEITETGMLRAYATYQAFLEQELNHHYQRLLAQVDQPSRQVLRESQNRWQQWREVELRFITSNWTPANFGSSSRITRAASRTLLLRHRIIELIHYRQHYADISPPGAHPP